MTWKDEIEAYVNIEYNDPTYKAKWEVTEKEDGTIHLKYIDPIPNQDDTHVLIGETDIHNGPCEDYQYIDYIKQKAYCLFHEVFDWCTTLTEFYIDKDMSCLPHEIHLDDIKQFLDKKTPTDDGIEIRETNK